MYGMNIAFAIYARGIGLLGVVGFSVLLVFAVYYFARKIKLL